MNRDIRNIFLGIFLSGTAMSVFGVLYNLYLKSSGVHEARIGLMLSSSSLGILAGILPGIWLVRRIPMKTLLVLPLLLYSVINIVRIFWISPAVLAFMGFLGGFVLASQGTVILPYIKNHSSPQQRMMIFGIFDGLGFGGAVLGSFLSGFLLDIFENGFPSGQAYKLTLSFSMFLGVLSVIPLLVIPPVVPEKTFREGKDEGQGIPVRQIILKPWTIFSKTVLWSVVAIDLLVGAGAGLTIPYLNLYLKSRLAIPNGTIGIIFALVNGGTFLALLASNFLARKIGAMWTVFLSQFLSIFLLFVLISGTQSVWIIGGALVLRGALINLGWPVLRNLSMEIASHHEQHTLTAVRSFAWNFAWMISSFLGGSLIEKMGYNPTIKMTALLYLFSSIVALFCFRSRTYRNFGLKGNYTFIPERETAPE